MKLLFISNQKMSYKSGPGNPVLAFLIDEIEKHNCQVDKIEVKSKNIIFKQFELTYRLIMLKISGKTYDAVNVHFGGMTAFIASFFFHEKLVLSFHGTDLHGGSFSNYISKFKADINVLASKLAARRASRVILVSENLKKAIGYHRDLEIIPTGVDYSVFKTLEKDLCKSILKLSNKKKYILFSDVSGSFVKRRDIALKVGNLLSKHSFELLIMSKVPSEKVKYYINASDLTLIVSDKEGSPNIIKESLACNVPVASVDVGDAFQYIQNEKQGIRLASKEPKEIAKSILEYFLNFEPLRTRNNLETKISNKFIAKKYLRVYKSLNE